MLVIIINRRDPFWIYLQIVLGLITEFVRILLINISSPLNGPWAISLIDSPHCITAGQVFVSHNSVPICFFKHTFVYISQRVLFQRHWSPGPVLKKHQGLFRCCKCLTQLRDRRGFLWVSLPISFTLVYLSTGWGFQQIQANLKLFSILLTNSYFTHFTKKLSNNNKSVCKMWVCFYLLATHPNLHIWYAK